MPGRINCFTDREEIFSKLRKNLTEGKTLVALKGMPAIGKTQIAIEYCYRYYKTYKTIGWLNDSNKLTLRTKLAEFVKKRKLPGYQQEDEDEVALLFKKYWSNFSQSNWLLIIDECR